MDKKRLIRIKRHRSGRLRITGTIQRPRLSVHRSLANLYGQIIDDTTNRTLFSLSTRDKEIKAKFPYGGNVGAATFLGEVFALRAKEKGIIRVVFDRGGYLYHGRIRAFAESLRKGGMDF
jgi:large subunit ribosomal protein L18